MDRDSEAWAWALGFQALLTFVVQRKFPSANPSLLAIPSALLGGFFMLALAASASGSVSNIWPIACAFYFIPGFFVGWVAAFIARHTRSKPIPPGCCQKCGYNLTGNVSGRCPECGSRIVCGPRPPKAGRP